MDYLSLPPLVRNYGLFVMGLDYVPGAARYLPDGPDGCPRSNGEWPINYVSSRPAAGNATFAFTLTSSATAATLLLGFDNVAWAGNLLPYDLGPLGATGCSLGTSAEVIAVTTAPLRIPVHLPNMIATFYTQWGVLDPANALGVVLSDARRMEIR